jgi:amino acid adenylation domain-containing protein
MTVDQTLDAAFARITARFPDRPAVADDLAELTYAQLDSAVSDAADTLRRHGIRPGDLVAVRVPPSIELIVALLAVLRAGAGYLPLDPAAPVRRATLILDDAAPVAVVESADDAGAGTVAKLAGSSVLRLRERPSPAALAAEGGPAYVIYTSGTTGRPKGVPVSHRNVLALFAATAGLFDFTADDRWLLFHSHAFDFSVWEIWGALLSGGRLFVPNRWTVIDPYEMARVIRDQRVTVLNQTPTAFGGLVPDLLALSGDLHLRYIVFGGERLRQASLGGWCERFPLERVALVNMYGITEITVHATFHRLTAADLASRASPIGAPLPGFNAAVMDDGRPAARGELWLAGPQVTAGYLNRPELTAARFQQIGGTGPVYYRSGDIVETGPDGVLCYVGRADDQVKIRGFRIELGEIEAAVTDVPGVRAACAFSFTRDSGEALACVYVTDGEPVADDVLRAELRARLPEYMVPSVLRGTRELPRTPNGKADRATLRRSLEPAVPPSDQE